MTSPTFGEDDSDLSLMMEAFAEAWVVSNSGYTFMSDDDLDGVAGMLGGQEEEAEEEDEEDGGMGVEKSGTSERNWVENEKGWVDLGTIRTNGVEASTVEDNYAAAVVEEEEEEEEAITYRELKAVAPDDLPTDASYDLVTDAPDDLGTDATDDLATDASDPSESSLLAARDRVARESAPPPTNAASEKPASVSARDAVRYSNHLSLLVTVEDSSSTRPRSTAVTSASAPSRSSQTQTSSPSATPLPPKRHPNTLVPPTIKIKDLVPFLLLKLGYLRNKAESPVADAYLLVERWSPLSLKTLCRSASQSFGHVLEPFARPEDVSLKIVIESWKTKDLVFKWNNEAVRTTLASLLRHYSQKKLAALCPFSQAYISMIARDSDSVVISEAKCLEFGNWFEKFTKKVISSAVATAGDVGGGGGGAFAKLTSSNEKRRASGSVVVDGAKNAANRPDNAKSTTTTTTPTTPPSSTDDDRRLSKTEFGLDSKPLQISFHARLELPLLKKWFSATPSPSEADLESFADKLNEAEWRKSADRIRVSKDKLRNWWKNERARRKRRRGREEGRGDGGGDKEGGGGGVGGGKEGEGDYDLNGVERKRKRAGDTLKEATITECGVVSYP